MISKNRQEEVKILSTTLSRHELASKFGVEVDTIRRYLSYNKEIPKAPKILIFDIETMFMTVSVWGISFKQRIPADNIIEDWNALSWSAKWLFDSEIMSDVLTSEEAIARDDSRVLKSIWKLLDESDIVIAHNGNKFDLRKLNARFIQQGLTPPLPYRSIDTLKVAKRYFAFSSYTLKFLCKMFGLSPKIHTGYELWKQCLKGDEEALKKMKQYNIGDILSLEELYLKLRPWIKSSVNFGVYMDTEESVCPNCGGKDLEWKGQYTTTAGRFKTFRCSNCGAIGRSRYSELGKEQRRNLTVSVAR